MTNNGIALHLTNTKTTLCPTTPRRLARPLLAPTLPTRIPLILWHVLQTHSIDIPHENLCRNHLAPHSIIHELIAKGLHPQLISQNLSNGLHRTPIIHKKSAIRCGPQGRRGLSYERLNQLRHRHTRGNRVRIHNHIHGNPLLCTRHVVTANKHSNRALLPVPVRELIAQLRYPLLDHSHLYHHTVLVIHSHGNLLHAPSCPYLCRLGCVHHIPTL